MNSFSGGSPPGPHAGDISSLTEALRPAIHLTPEQCRAARRLRRRGRPISEISFRLAVPEDEVRQALATMRTPKRTSTRKSLNVTVAAHEFVQSEAVKNEACWEVVDRLLIELTLRRALMGSPLRMGSRV